MTPEVSLEETMPTIHIENPLPGHAAATTLKRATHFVRARRAVSVNRTTIRFVAPPQFVIKSAEEALHAKLCGLAIDRINRTMTRREMLNLPLVNPDRALRNEKSSRDWSYSAAVRRDRSPADTPEEVARIRDGRGKHL